MSCSTRRSRAFRSSCPSLLAIQKRILPRAQVFTRFVRFAGAAGKRAHGRERIRLCLSGKRGEKNEDDNERRRRGRYLTVVCGSDSRRSSARCQKSKRALCSFSLSGVCLTPYAPRHAHTRTNARARAFDLCEDERIGLQTARHEGRSPELSGLTIQRPSTLSGAGRRHREKKEAKKSRKKEKRKEGRKEGRKKRKRQRTKGRVISRLLIHHRYFSLSGSAGFACVQIVRVPAKYENNPATRPVSGSGSDLAATRAGISNRLSHARPT